MVSSHGMAIFAAFVFATLIGQSALTGTWSAQRIYGPVFQGGPVVVTKSHGWLAKAEGASVHAPPSSRPIFIFSDRCELRLRVFGDKLEGQWIQPGDQENANAIATPVAFVIVRAGVWRGNARPIIDSQHLTLVVNAPVAGVAHAFLLNPEQNAGLFAGLRTLSLRGSTVRLHRDGADDIVGGWDPQRNALVLKDPGLPGTFVFRRIEMKTPHPLVYELPQRTSDGWTTGTLAGAGIDPAAIAKLIDSFTRVPGQLRSPRIQALLIARHGRLVVDQYFDGFNADRSHDVRSAGKSVTTLMVGRAIELGAGFAPSTPISSILTKYVPFANYSLSKDRIRVADLMSMSAGYACDDNDDASPGGEDRMQTQTAQPDWYKFTLDLPMAFSPGARALYCSAEINLLGAIIEERTKTWLPDFFYENFARPMQFGSYGMWLMPPPNHTAYMAGGDVFRPRDFLKFGELFLDGGRWHGDQVLDSAWLTAVSTKHSYVEDGGGDYGFGWHLETYRQNGRDVRAIVAGGNGGQLLYVFPQLDMTVMVTGGNYGDYRVWSRFEKLIPNAILAAVKTPR